MGNWDNDFVFDVKTSVKSYGERAVGKGNTSVGSNEDWDHELLDEEVLLEDDGTPEFSSSSDENLDASNSDLSLFDQAKPESTKVHSLLEYLDDIEGTESTRVESAATDLPRPPILYSVSRHPSRSASPRQQNETSTLITAAAADTATAVHPISTSLSNIARLHAIERMSQQDVGYGLDAANSSSSRAGFPHAPESGAGVIAWLSNISAKVRTTSAVVARPAPKLIDGRECERLPREELPLETALRLAEMAYCVRGDSVDEDIRCCESSADIINAVKCVKRLLRRADEARMRARGVLPLLVALGSDEMEQNVVDLDSRTKQCCGRLVRLVCRTAQRSDELLLRDRARLLFPGSGKTSTDVIDATDVSALRRLAQTFIDDVEAPPVRLQLELLVEEALGHLALLHCRGPRKAACKRDLGEASCYCSALPPLPRAGFAKILASCRSLMASSPSDSALTELESSAFADLLLDTAGYSPLTCEQLLTEQGVLSEQGGDDSLLTTEHTSLGESPCRSLRVVLNNDAVALISSLTTVASLKMPQAARSDSNLHQPKANFSIPCALPSAEKARHHQLLPSTRELEQRLGLLIRLLPPHSLARAKAAFAVGISHLRGGERLARFTKKAKMKKKEPPAVAAAQNELRSAEMLLFEAACVIEQHSTSEPIDLPCYACRYAYELNTTSRSSIIFPGSGSEAGHADRVVANKRPATAYSVLAGSLGFAVLRALARALDRRGKHIYAVHALEVCVSILELRDDKMQRRRLERELAIVAARQGDCSSYCLSVLRNLDEEFVSRSSSLDVDATVTLGGDMSITVPSSALMMATSTGESTTGQGDRCIPSSSTSQRSSIQPVSIMSGTYHSESCALCKIHELLLVTELAVSRLTRNSTSRDYARALDVLIELAQRLEYRLRLVEPGAAAARELEGLVDRVQLGMARFALDQARSAEATSILDACLASSRKCSSTKRVAILSWASKARLELGDLDACRAHLLRIARIRKMRQHTIGLLGWFRPARFGIRAQSSATRYSEKIAVSTLNWSNTRSHFVPRSGTFANCDGSLIRGGRFLNCGSEHSSTGSHLPVKNRGPRILVGEACASGILLEIQPCLLTHCGPSHDVAELEATSAIRLGDASAALRALAPAVATVEAFVSRQATRQGLLELGRLYKLRGNVQDMFARHVVKSDFPFRLEREVVRKPIPTRSSSIQDILVEKASPTWYHQLPWTPESMISKSRSKITREQEYQNEAPNSSLVWARRLFAGSVTCQERTDVAPRLVSKAPRKKRWYTRRKSPHSVRSNVPSLSGKVTTAKNNVENFHTTLPHPRIAQSVRPRPLARSGRHFQSYADADELAVDSLRWYRHALECYRACGDDLGVANCASAFSRLQIERLIGPVAFERAPLEAATDALLFGESLHTQQSAGAKALDSVEAAVRCALSIAAMACEPFLLLETYLNVAELRLMKRDRLGAIAHWWEARELFLRLLVSGLSVPVVTSMLTDVCTIAKIRMILERLVRFLAACDRAMINENILLFEIFIVFEREARITCNDIAKRYFLLKSQHSLVASAELAMRSHSSLNAESIPESVGDAALRCFDLERAQAGLSRMNHSVYALNSFISRSRAVRQLHLSSSAVDYAQRSSFGLETNCSDVEVRLFRLRLGLPSNDVYDSIKYDEWRLWECLVRVRADVTRYRRLPVRPLSTLRERNRYTLRLLTSQMRRLCEQGSSTQATSYDALSEMIDCSASSSLKNLVYALHAAATLFIYCPRTGARRAVALGRGSRRYFLEGNSSGIARGLSRNTAGPRASSCRLGKRECIPAELSVKSALVVAALIGDRTQHSKSRNVVLRQTDYGATLRGSMLNSLKNDLDIPPDLFEDLLACGSRIQASKSSKSSVRLVCSERAQILPWECLTDNFFPIIRSSGAIFYSYKQFSRTTPQSSQDIVVDLIAPLCRRDTLYTAAVCLVRLGRFHHTECDIWPDPFAAAVALSKPKADVTFHRRLMNVAGCLRASRASSPSKHVWTNLERNDSLRVGDKREIKDTLLYNDQTVLVHNFALLSASTDSLKSLLAAETPILLAPSTCLDAVRKDTSIHFGHHVPDQECPPLRVALRSWTIAEFAQAMTRKYAAPVVHFECPPPISFP